jgi:acyl carrier protein
MYRTGDLARYCVEGEIEFLGRIDHQVKIRGFRIELGEIEATLVSDPAVREAVVVAQESQTGDKQLVAYLVPHQEHLTALQKLSNAQSSSSSAQTEKPLQSSFNVFKVSPDSALSAENLRNHLLVKLPDYMVPSAFVLLDRMPLLSSGKVDRKALPAAEQSRLEMEHGYVAPRNEVEQVLAEILAEMLGLQRVGVHDDFFKLGGHSLLATQVMSRILEKFQVELPVQQLFEQPTAATLAESVLKTRGFRPEAFSPITKFKSADELLLAKIDQLTDEEVERLLGTFDDQDRGRNEHDHRRGSR